MALTDEQLTQFFQVLKASKLPSELTPLTNPTSSHFLVIQAGEADALSIDVETLRGYLGGYNAVTNTPSLSDVSGLEGTMYKVTDAATRNFGSGSIELRVDDVIAYRGGRWVRLINFKDLQGYYTKAEIDAILADLSSSSGSSSDTYITSGHVDSTGGFDIKVYASYYFTGIFHQIQGNPHTLSAADPTNPRKDVVALDNTGNSVIIEGTPAVNPVEPTIDYETQIKLTTIDIPAGATEPTGLGGVLIYDENTGSAGGEWDVTENTSGARIDIVSTTSPQTGTKAIEGTGLNNGDSVTFTASAPISIANFTQLSFYIKNKLATNLGDFRFILVGKKSNGQAYSEVMPEFSAYGYSNTDTSNYQFVSLAIPTNTRLTEIDSIIFTNYGQTSAGLGFFLDKVEYKEGTESNLSQYATIDYVNSQVATKANDSEVVKSVNSQTPDVNGNVNVSASPDQRETANVTTTKNIDWSKEVFEFTMTADTTFSDSNLPTGANAKTITLYLTGNFIPTFPAYYTLEPGDAYDGTKVNRIQIDCVNGTASSEVVYYSIKNLS